MIAVGRARGMAAGAAALNPRSPEAGPRKVPRPGPAAEPFAAIAVLGHDHLGITRRNGPADTTCVTARRAADLSPQPPGLPAPCPTTAESQHAVSAPDRPTGPVPQQVRPSPAPTGHHLTAT